jgi:hypothetical protein
MTALGDYRWGFFVGDAREPIQSSVLTNKTYCFYLASSRSGRSIRTENFSAINILAILSNTSSGALAGAKGGAWRSVTKPLHVRRL